MLPSWRKLVEHIIAGVRRIRARTGRITALDLPGQISQALHAGILSGAEAAVLRDYDAKVSNLIDVDDFAPHELGAGSGGAANPVS